MTHQVKLGSATGSSPVNKACLSLLSLSCPAAFPSSAEKHMCGTNVDTVQGMCHNEEFVEMTALEHTVKDDHFVHTLS